MAHGVGFLGPMTSSKCKQIRINIPTSCQHQQKNDIQSLNVFLTRFFVFLFFFNYKTSRVFTGSDSSLAQSAGELLPLV